MGNITNIFDTTIVRELCRPGPTRGGKVELYDDYSCLILDRRNFDHAPRSIERDNELLPHAYQHVNNKYLKLIERIQRNFRAYKIRMLKK